MAPDSVKWFGDEKDFGFIAPDDRSQELFLRNSAIDGGDYRPLAEGPRVSYNAEAGEEGPKAANVQLT